MRVVRSTAATADIHEAVVYYRDEAGPEIALRFVDDLEEAVGHIADWPGSGSTRFAELLGIPGLRSFAIARFPYVVFYMESADHIDVWRVLHGRRDIPQTLLDYGLSGP